MTEKICVHLPTQEAYDTYMQWAERRGLVREGWSNPTSIDVWKFCKNECCVCFWDRFGWRTKSYYEREWYRIISAEEAMQMEEQKTSKEAEYRETAKKTKMKEAKSILEAWFTYEEKPEFVRGEIVEVKSGDERFKATYYGTIEWERHPYIAKVQTNSWYSAWDRIRKLPQQEVWPRKFTVDYLYKFAKKSKNSKDCLLTEFCAEHGMLEE